jgi:hypothetical protein
VGLAWSYYPESYAGGSVANGKVCHAEQVTGDEPNKKGFPDPLVLGLGGLTTAAMEKH